MDSLKWNDLWQKGLEKSTMKWWVDSVGFWNKRSNGFALMQRQEARANKIINYMNIQSEDTILDIGAGSGILTTPFADYSAAVTAIEPSNNMMIALEKRIKNEELNNVTLLKKKWEEIILGKDIEQYDYVVASYCLSMFDMKAALEKMNSTAIQGVCLFTYAGGIAGDKYYKEIWELIYKEKFYPSPDYCYIYNILYEMGIFANVEINTNLLKRQYKDIKEATDQWKDALDIKDEIKISQLEKYLQENLMEEKGMCYLIQETKNAMIWWKKY